MAKLPTYTTQGGITTQTPGNIQELDVNAQGAINLQKGAETLLKLTMQWQESKDEVANLNGRVKLQEGISSILNEAQNYNDYNNEEELRQKQAELKSRMNELVPDIVSGFSNNKKARIFEMEAGLTTTQNGFKLDDIFRNKFGDMYMADLDKSADMALKNYTQTGNENYKKEYSNAIDVGVKSGYLDREKAEKMKLGMNDWNYTYVYSKILENPYFKASPEVMSKIKPTQLRQLENLQRSEQRQAKAEALNSAMNDYYLNPTQANLNRIYKLNPKARGSRQLEGMLQGDVNYNAITSIEGMSDALDVVKELSQMDKSTPQGKNAYTKAASALGLKIYQLQKEGNLKEKDKSKLFNMIYNQMNDDNFRQKISELPNLSKEWNNQYSQEYGKLHDNYLRAEQKLNSTALNSPEYKVAKANYDKAWQQMNYYSNSNYALNKNRLQNAPLGVQTRIKQLQREAAANMLDAYALGDINKANKIKEQYGNDMVRLKYWNIPELQRKDLKAGDKFTINGKVYSYQGFSKNDVIVEVN